jgi:hypothetical protein
MRVLGEPRRYEPSPSIAMSAKYHILTFKFFELHVSYENNLKNFKYAVYLNGDATVAHKIAAILLHTRLSCS